MTDEKEEIPEEKAPVEEAPEEKGSIDKAADRPLSAVAATSCPAGGPIEEVKKKELKKEKPLKDSKK